jgi:DNA-binding response OmpR family regulator
MGRCILVVEDEPAIRDGVRRACERDGFTVLTAAGVTEALAIAGREDLSLVLLDLGLPDGDGRDLCVELRRRSDVPIIILSARGSEVDRIVGLELGADDYVVKPFSSGELLARVRAVLRRSEHRTDQAAPVTSGALALDPGSRRATVAEVELELTRREYDVLYALVRRGTDVTTREQLYDEVWGGDWFGSPKVLDVQLSALRRKLAAAAGPAIETVRGVGYRMAA